MFLKKIKLSNFRNYSKFDIDFDQVTLLIGSNAQGKSNLLEAIYFLATTKSPRVEKDSQLIKDGENFTTVAGEVEGAKLDIGMHTQDGVFVKRVKVNGIPKRVVDYIGNLVVVMFSPEDINLVAGPPALRRWHIDLTLAQIDRDYKRALTEYSEVIVSRNRILKKMREEAGLSGSYELDFWDKKALETGTIVSLKRQELFDFINQAEASLSKFSFEYLPSLLSTERSREYLPREIAAATSLIGPHRDDFIFKLYGKDLAVFGSRGEARTAVLDLKLTELEYINQIKKTRPVLLLDDIFSELDEQHRLYVVSVINRQQTILSAVETENIPKDFLKSVKVIRVDMGKIVKVIS